MEGQWTQDWFCGSLVLVSTMQVRTFLFLGSLLASVALSRAKESDVTSLQIGVKVKIVGFNPDLFVWQ